MQADLSIGRQEEAQRHTCRLPSSVNLNRFLRSVNNLGKRIGHPRNKQFVMDIASQKCPFIFSFILPKLLNHTLLTAKPPHPGDFQPRPQYQPLLLLLFHPSLMRGLCGVRLLASAYVDTSLDVCISLSLQYIDTYCLLICRYILPAPKPTGLNVCLVQFQLLNRM